MRSGAGRGGCQERSSVIYGRLLLAYLCVRHGIGFRSLVGFLVLDVLSSSLDSSTNQPLNLSLSNVKIISRTGGSLASYYC